MKDDENTPETVFGFKLRAKKKHIRFWKDLVNMFWIILCLGLFFASIGVAQLGTCYHQYKNWDKCVKKLKGKLFE